MHAIMRKSDGSQCPHFHQREQSDDRRRGFESKRKTTSSLKGLKAVKYEKAAGINLDIALRNDEFPLRRMRTDQAMISCSRETRNTKMKVNYNELQKAVEKQV